jgi:anti-anti-sigma regulatory factor
MVMKKVRIKLINVADKLATVVASRDITRTLEKLILDARESEVSLDFKNVDFISRSAAHELLMLQEELARRVCQAIQLSFVNTNKHVATMLKVVAASRTSPKKPPSDLHIKTISFDSLRSLASI